MNSCGDLKGAEGTLPGVQSQNCWSSRGWERRKSRNLILPPSLPPSPLHSGVVLGLSLHWRGLCHGIPYRNRAPVTDTRPQTPQSRGFCLNTQIFCLILTLSSHLFLFSLCWTLTTPGEAPCPFLESRTPGNVAVSPPLGGLFSFTSDLWVFLQAQTDLISTRTFPQHSDSGTPRGICYPSVIYTKPALNSVTFALFLSHLRVLPEQHKLMHK